MLGRSVGAGGLLLQHRPNSKCQVPGAFVKFPALSPYSLCRSFRAIVDGDQKAALGSPSSLVRAACIPLLFLGFPADAEMCEFKCYPMLLGEYQRMCNWLHFGCSFVARSLSRSLFVWRE